MSHETRLFENSFFGLALSTLLTLRKNGVPLKENVPSKVKPFLESTGQGDSKKVKMKILALRKLEKLTKTYFLPLLKPGKAICKQMSADAKGHKATFTQRKKISCLDPKSLKIGQL